ncbi:SGNH/GDSL hydrolase family protein [Blastococcus colisei]|uniref:SGNH/GDSL hydrolase family protein n=1 Tax=Blastococcus colisei TaxID=1564162 RepID=UPI001476F7F0|nr:SGNH/GDSL hydrolase family protein [Blastococcus colisei]
MALQAWSGSGTYDETPEDTQLVFEVQVTGGPLVPRSNIQIGLPFSYLNFVCRDPGTGSNLGGGGFAFDEEEAVSVVGDVTTYRLTLTPGAWWGECRLISAMLVAQSGAQQEYPSEDSLATLGSPFLVKQGSSTDGIALSSWNATVGADRSVIIDLTVSGGGGLQSRFTGEASVIGYVCVDAVTGEDVYGHGSLIGAEELVSGSTYRSGPHSQNNPDYPTLNCHMNAAYLYGKDGSSKLYYTVEDLQAAGLTLEFSIPGPDVAPRPPVDTTLTYVALGDSFAAGEGVEPFWQPPDYKCHRSQLAYPRYVEQPGVPDASIFDRLGTDDVEWGFQACSGARTWHVLPTEMGGKGNHGDPLPQLEQNRAADTDNVYDLPVDESVELVTITIGGNNVDFSSILGICYSSSDCTKARVNGRVLEAEITRRLSALGRELDKVYAQIRLQAPNARILVAGYPHLFPATAKEQNCPKLAQRPYLRGTRGPSATLGFSRKEQNFLRGQTSRLNQVIADRVNNTRWAEFVPVDAIFAGHEVCGKSGEWINAPQVTARWPSPVNDQSFHPNEHGHELGYAAAINAVLHGVTF